VEVEMGELPLNQILCGDCADLLKGFPENSVDLVVTDPNYGLGFMGLDWDKALPPREAFKQVIRVLKPGALAFVMSSPRQDLMWRMCALLEGVGFEMRQSFLSWIYKTGFPKAYDVSKGIDQKLGKERDKVTKFAENFRGGKLHSKADSRRSWIEVQSDTPISDLAKQWAGWKSQTGLKPALEPILMVNKPFSEPTIVDNVLRWGTGAINVDACRIPFQNQADVEQRQKNDMGSRPNKGQNYGRMGKVYDSGHGTSLPSFKNKGRFPANLLISDGALDTGETTKSGKFEPHHKIAKDENGHSVKNVYGKYRHLPADQQVFYGDEGSPYRYFNLDAWAEHHGFLDVPKPDTAERDYGLKGKKSIPKSKFNLNDGSKDERFDGAVSIPRRNTHPTVKPIKLMAYLIELGCPRNGIVLDPFVGSGTTCIAAKHLGRRYVGIEISEKYHALAEARVAAYPQPLEWFTEDLDRGSNTLLPTNKQTKRTGE